ncbi:MAG: cysteine desulfurase NifS [Clostridiales bacterium]|jgi:cysteine desulfurase|nr:cysteine desulfurase NifS [Clostridiales bacterium]
MVYLDNAATTPVRDEVLEAMMPYFKEEFGNASTSYKLGHNAKNALENSRTKVAEVLNTNANEILFTSGGTESDNFAIKGYARAHANKGKHIITSNIEHHAVSHSLKSLQKEGFEVTEVPVNSEGIVEIAEFEKAIRPDTILATIMQANNEIGTIQPIKELAEIAHKNGFAFHTDAVQSIAHIPVDINDLGVDMLSLSGHKFGAMKGIGAIYVKKGIKLDIFNDGGGQEKGRRAGTENIAGIVGLAKALELAQQELPEEMPRLSKLRDTLMDGLLERIPGSRVNGSRTQRVPGNVNMSFPYVEGESMLIHLDLINTCAASGSACTSGSLDPSHVLLAIGLDHATAHGSIRFSIGKDNTEEDIKFVLDNMPKIVEKLQAMSPLKPQGNTKMPMYSRAM